MSSKKRRVEKQLDSLKKQRDDFLLFLEGREETHPNEQGCLDRLCSKIVEHEIILIDWDTHIAKADDVSSSPRLCRPAQFKRVHSGRVR